MMISRGRMICWTKAVLLVPLWLLVAGASALAQDISARAAVGLGSYCIEGIRGGV